MDDFIGNKCIVCNNAFTADDDIVVCPECGTPYHRACYKTTGQCVNFALHEHGESWKPEVTVEKNDLSDTLCSRCGKQNPESTLFCEACGFPLKSFIKTEKPLRAGMDAAEQSEQDNLLMHPYLVNYSDPLCGLNPDEDFDGVKLSEIAEYVDKNTHYYLPIFKSFKTLGRYFSWNFIAFIFPELYFAHRKMILAALGAMAVRLVVMLPRLIAIFANINFGELSELAQSVDINSGPFKTFSVIFIVADYVRMWLYSTNANKLYYRKVIKDIKRCKQSMTQVEIPGSYFNNELAVRLQKMGGTSALWLSLFTCLLLLPVFSLYMYVLFSGFLPGV
jgi:ribosomal protein L37E